MTDDGDNDKHVYDVVIVGGAIAGMATALGLVRRGVTKILLLEKATKLQPVGASICLFSNGLKALEYLCPDVAAKVKQSCIPIETMVVQDQNGTVLHEKKPPTKEGVNFLVWYLLQQYLAEGLPASVLKMGHSLDGFEVGGDDIVTLFVSHRQEPSGEEAALTNQTIRTKCLVGADGIWSNIRTSLFGPTQKNYHDKLMYRAALSMDLIDPKHAPAAGVNIGVQGDAPGKLFSYRETAKGILTVTSMSRVEDGDDSTLPIDSIQKLTPSEKKELMCQAFEEYPAAVQNILSSIPDESVHVDAIRDVDVVENASKGPVILVGDAGHAMSPSLGQGANQSLEDAAHLVHALAKLFKGPQDATSPTAVASALEEVWQQRFERVTMIHAASRARSIENNKSSANTKPVDMKSTELKEALRKIGDWSPPVD